MAKQSKISNEAASAEADALCALLTGGVLCVYEAPKPATADTALSGQKLLATLTFGTPAFAAAVNGVAAANAITKDSSADDTGTAAWFRAYKSDGVSAILDGTVGVTNQPAPGDTYNLLVATTSFVAGAEITCSSFSYTAQKG